MRRERPVVFIIKKDTMVTWSKNVEDIEKALTALSATQTDGKPLAIKAAFAIWTEWTVKIRKGKQTVFLIGNGASASMASHVAVRFS